METKGIKNKRNKLLKTEMGYVSLAEVAKTSPYSQEYLSLLARQGKLRAKKFGRNWYIAPEALNDYLTNQGIKIVLPKHLFNTSYKGRITKAFFPTLAQFSQEPIDLSGALGEEESASAKASADKEEKPQVIKEPFDAAQGKEKILQPSLIKTMRKDIAALGGKKVADKPKIFKTIISQFRKVFYRKERIKIPEKVLEKAPEKIPLMEKKEVPMLAAPIAVSRVGQEKKPFDAAQGKKEISVEEKVLERLLQVLEARIPVGISANQYFRSTPKAIVVSAIAIIIILLLVGGVSFGNLDKVTVAVNNFFKDAITLQGSQPGTHANEVLLLDKNGNVSIYGHIETKGQLRSWVEQGVAPIVVVSTTTVENLSADYLDNLSSQEFTLAFVTKNGNVTYENVYLEGDVEVGKTLLVKGAAKLLDSLFVYGTLGAFGGIDTAGANLNLGSGTIVTTNQNLVPNLNADRLDSMHASDFDLNFITSNGSNTYNDISVGGLNVSGFFGQYGSFRIGGGERDVGLIDTKNWSISTAGHFYTKGSIKTDYYLTAGGPAKFTGTPGSALSGATVYINPSSASADTVLLGLAVGGAEKFKVDAEGDLTVAGTALISGASTFQGNIVLSSPANLTLNAGDLIVNKLATSSNVSAQATTSSSGSLTAGTYYYVVTALNNNGETSSSTEVSATVDGATTTAVSISWSAVSGASGYRVYGRAQGAQNQYWETTATSLADTGTAGTVSAVPTANTTGGNGTFYSGLSVLGTTISRSILPETSNFYNLGSPDFYWSNLYVGTVNATTTNQYGNIIMSDDKWIGFSSSTGRLVFDDQTPDYLTIQDARLGIATTTPSEQLAVAGNIMGSGNMVLYGSATSTIAGPVELASSFRTAGNIYPSADVTYMLGSPSARWANIYAATTTIGGTIIIDTDDIRATGALTVSSTDMRIMASAGDLAATSSNAIYFATNNIERLRINSAGYVGIGTTTLAGLFTVGTTTPALVVSSVSYVGIGTSTPSTNLSVVGNIMGSGNMVLYGTATSTISGPVELASSFRTAGNIYPSADVTYMLGSPSARWANIYTATTTIGGTVTIDTDDIRASGLLTISATDMRLSASVGDISATSSNAIYFATNNKERLRINSAGYVGIGTTTLAGLFTVGTSTPALVVASNGYVGIGTTTPSEVLSVVGNIVGTGNMTITGTYLTLSGSVMPASPHTQDIGSAAYDWQNIYVANVYANNINAASTTISGTSAETFTINSDTVEDATSSLRYYRGIETPHALLTWDAGYDRFNFNFPLYLSGTGSITAASALNLTGNAASTWETASGSLTVQSADVLIASSTGAFIFGAGGSEVARFLTSGNLGLGTTNASTTLHILSTAEQLRLANTAQEYVSFTVASDGALELLATGTDADIEFRTKNFNDAIFIDDSTSRVGIASSTPSDTFAVQGNMLGVGNLVISGTINTGQGANELYAMDQNVRTTDTVTFANLILTYGISAATTTITATSTLASINADSGLLYVDAYTDRIGIGTTGPQEKLTLASASNFATEMAVPASVSGTTITGTLTATTYYIKVVALDGVGTTIGSSEYSTTTAAAQAIQLSWTAPQGAQSYRVYVGTSSGGQDRYYAATSTTYWLATTTVNQITGTVPTATTAYVNKTTASGNSWLLGGNLGLATTSPRYKLDVWGDIGFGTSTGSLVPALYVDSGDGGRVGIGTTTLAGLFTVGTTTPALVVSPLSYVGIGTSTPSAQLAVAGNILGSGNIVLYGTEAAGTATSSFVNIRPSADAQYLLGSSNYKWANIYAATTTIGSGSLVIGPTTLTTPDTLTISAIGNLTTTSTGDIILVAGGSERARILSTGNIGIATTTPAYPLVINNASANAFIINSSGQVISGTWQGTVIADAYIPDTITASNYLLKSDWFTTTTQISITSIPTLSITESQISNLGNYLTYTAATSTYLQIAYASTTYLQISSTTPYKITSLPNLSSVGTLTTGSGNVSLWTNDSDYINWTQASSTYTPKASTTLAYVTSIPGLSITESQVSNLGNYLTYGVATSTYLQIAYASTTFSTFAYASSTYLQISSTTPYKITSLPNLTSIGGYVTALGFTGKASTTAALAANPTNCNAGEYPLGIDDSGNVESCTDATTEINSALGAYVLTTYASTTFSTFTYASTTYLQIASTSPYKITTLPNLSLTKGYFMVGDGNGKAMATSTIFIDSTGNVGIGTTGPPALLSVGSAAPASPLGVEMVGFYSNNTASIAFSRASNDGSPAGFDFFKSRGTHATPLTVTAGDTLGSFAFHAYNGAWRYNLAIISAITETGVGTGADVPTALNFYTTPDGSATFQERMRITGSGNIGIGTAGPSSKLTVFGGNLVVGDGTATTTITNTTLTVANIGAFTATGAINFNSQDMTNVDIDSGTIDGTTITGGTIQGSPSAGTGLTMPAFTLGGQYYGRSIDDGYLIIGAGPTYPAVGGMILLAGKSLAGTPGIVELQTPNAALANLPRLTISGALDTAVATWSAVTHTGLVLSGALNANSQQINNINLQYVNYTNLLENGDFEVGDPPTGWSGVGTIARTTEQVKIGSYALKLSAALNVESYARQNRADLLSYMKGRKVTLGCWVYATAASRVRLLVWDDIGGTNSSYHSGVAGWEWITITHTISATATGLWSVLIISAGAATSAYFDGAILVEGDSVPAFSPKPLWNTANLYVSPSTGYVGIGTTGPNARLEVYKAGSAANDKVEVARFTRPLYTGDTSGGGPYLSLQNSDVILGGIQGIREVDSWDSALAFYTHTASAGNTWGTTITEKMRISSTGNVGIGTTTPQTALDTYGNLRILAKSPTYPSFGEGIEMWYNADNDTGVITSYDRNTSAYKPLLIEGSYLAFLNSGSEKMRITAGNVGIGTTTPATKLEIFGDAATISIRPSSQTSSVSFLAGTPDWTSTYHTAALTKYGDSAAGTLLNTSLAKANLGHLDFNNVSAGLISAYGNVPIVFAQGISSTLTEVMRITGGNVGIGTTAPEMKLDVNGNFSLIASDGVSRSRRQSVTFTKSEASDYVRLTLDQEWAGNNGGGVRVKVAWMGDHATGSAYQEYSLAYSTAAFYTNELTISDVTPISRIKAPDSHYPYNYPPNVKFYLDATGNGLVMEVIGEPTGSTAQILIETEVFGQTVTTPTLTNLGTSAPSGMVELARTLNIDGNVNFTGKLYEDGVEILSGMISIFDTSCPTGWTRFTALDSKFPQGAVTYGGTGGALNKTTAGHVHTQGVTGGPSGTVATGGFSGGNTAADGYHTHTNPNTNSAADSISDIRPPYLDVVFCKKNAGSDLAEWTSSKEKYEPGTLVVLDPTANERVVIAEKPYDSTVVGVVSTQPGWTIGSQSDDALALALSGRVPAKVSLLNGPIKIGDSIAASSIPGVGMKASKPGAVVGKAMANFNEESTSKDCIDPVSGQTTKCGEIIIFINLSWYAGSLAEDGSFAIVTDATSTTSTSSVLADGFVEELKSIVSVVADAITGIPRMIVNAVLEVKNDVITHGAFKSIVKVAKTVVLGRTIVVDNAATAENSQLEVAAEDAESLSFVTYSIVSPRKEIMVSGSGRLLANSTSSAEVEAKIAFHPYFSAIISTSTPIRVVVTPTTYMNGNLYVAEKSIYGFTIKEINSQDAGGEFDWIVTARLTDPDLAQEVLNNTETIATQEVAPPAGGATSDAVCQNGASRPCSSEVGVCQIGIQICEQGVWGECIGAVMPTNEICDGVDNDCDGIIDEGGVCSAIEPEPQATSTEPIITTSTEPIVTSTEPIVEPAATSTEPIATTTTP